ncbi:hypothetical protein B0H12DRAFT_539264 [Mycena haematopus]|nr:hypothetical protein B0H12DRAFT_539264 [Mycena haematopus]
MHPYVGERTRVGVQRTKHHVPRHIGLSALPPSPTWSREQLAHEGGSPKDELHGSVVNGSIVSFATAGSSVATVAKSPFMRPKDSETCMSTPCSLRELLPSAIGTSTCTSHPTPRPRRQTRPRTLLPRWARGKVRARETRCTLGGCRTVPQRV